MKRQADLSEISDGKLYRSSDMVKCDTLGCEACDGCCRSMEETIVIDPYDMYRLQKLRGIDFDLLLSAHAKLKVIDGLIFPVLLMSGEWDACTFLNSQGRCSIHDARPGICRMFPLGRYYQDGDFRYFLQIHECGGIKAKTKIKKWLDTPDLPRYENYIQDWHDFTDGLEHRLEGSSENTRKGACLYLLQAFYRVPWKVQEDFYPQFEDRLSAAKKSV